MLHASLPQSEHSATYTLAIRPALPSSEHRWLYQLAMPTYTATWGGSESSEHETDICIEFLSNDCYFLFNLILKFKIVSQNES